jgi:hypothetical protein
MDEIDRNAGLDAEFQDQKRKGLITEVLKGLRRAEEETFGKDSPTDSFHLQPGIWALLWFSDMEKEIDDLRLPVIDLCLFGWRESCRNSKIKPQTLFLKSRTYLIPKC